MLSAFAPFGGILRGDNFVTWQF